MLTILQSSSFSLIWLSFFFGVIGTVLTSGCAKVVQQPQSYMRPHIVITPAEKKDLALEISKHFIPFDLASLWGRELACGWSFMQEADYFRAITSFRKADIFIQNSTCQLFSSYEEKNALRIQAITGVILSYVLSNKFSHAIQAWESVQEELILSQHKEAKWLLLLLVEAYSATSASFEQALSLASLLPQNDPDREKLLCYLALQEQSYTVLSLINAKASVNSLDSNNIQAIEDDKKLPLSSSESLYVETSQLFAMWQRQKKNPNCARIMNFLLPGSGYAYVGQFPTAFTSLSINTLFIGATIEFFKATQPCAALIALGLETGWYGGGAVGAQYAAEEYNQQKWADIARKFMQKKGIYPEAMLWNAICSDNKKTDNKKID